MLRRIGQAASATADTSGVPPEIIDAAKKLAPGEVDAFLKDAAKAAAIIGASSAIPVVGTAGGAVIAAVTILGPRIFVGIKSLFTKRENPWPDRIAKVVSSSKPADEKYLALYALQQLAASRVTGGDSSTRRWARGAIARIDAAVGPLWSQLSPEKQRLALARVAAPGAETFARMDRAALMQFILKTQQILGAGWSDFQRAHPDASRGAVQAQLALATDIFNARAVPYIPPTLPSSALRAKKGTKPMPKKRRKKARSRAASGAEIVRLAKAGKVRTNRGATVTPAELRKAAEKGRVFFVG